jgi:hypothetical protein
MLTPPETIPFFVSLSKEDINLMLPVNGRTAQFKTGNECG